MPNTITLTKKEVREAMEGALVGEGCFNHDYQCFWWYEEEACMLMGDEKTCRLCKKLTQFVSQGDSEGKGEEDEPHEM